MEQMNKMIGALETELRRQGAEVELVTDRDDKFALFIFDHCPQIDPVALITAILDARVK